MFRGETRRRNFLGSTLAVLAASCSSSSEPLEIPLPDLSQRRSAIVAIEVGGAGALNGVASVQAVPIEDGELDPVWLPRLDDFPNEGDARVSVLSFDRQALEDLGLEPGEVPGGGELPLGLGADRLEQSVVRSGVAGEFEVQPLATLEPPLSEFRYPDRRPECHCFPGEFFSLKGTSATAISVGMVGPQEALVVTGHHAETTRSFLWKISPGTSTEQFAPLDVGSYALPDIASAVIEDFDVLAGEGSIIITSTSADLMRIRWKDGGPVGEAPELIDRCPFRAFDASGTPLFLNLRWFAWDERKLYMLSVRGRFLRYDFDAPVGERWKDLESGFDEADSYVHGGVARIAPGVMAAVSPRDPWVAIYDENRVPNLTREAIMPEEGIASIAQVPGVGTVIATALTGRFYVRDQSDWSPCASQLGNAVGAIVPYRGGLIGGSTQGLIEQYAPGHWCEQLKSAQNSIRFMIPFGPDPEAPEGFVASGPPSEESGEPFPTVTLMLRGVFDDCRQIRNPAQEPLPMCTLPME